MIRRSQQEVEVDFSGRPPFKPLFGATVAEVRAFMVVMARAQGASPRTVAKAIRRTERSVFSYSDPEKVPDLGPVYNRAMLGIEDDRDEDD